MKINLASLGQQVQSIMNQECILLLKVTLKDTRSKCILERHQNDIDTLTNALPGRKLLVITKEYTQEKVHIYVAIVTYVLLKIKFFLTTK